MGRVGIATGLALTAALSLSGCGKKAAPKGAAAADTSPVVEVARVSTASGEHSITATGALKRVRESNLSFRIPGVITRLTVDEGDFVKAGQVIATVDPTAVDARLRQAAGDLERAKRDLARAEPLVERGAFSRQQVDDARTAAANAKAAYDSAAFDRRWATLTSPVSGVVLSRTAQNGEVVAAGQAVVQVADTNSPLALRAPVPRRGCRPAEGGRRGSGEARRIARDRRWRAGSSASVSGPRPAPARSRSRWLSPPSRRCAAA